MEASQQAEVDQGQERQPPGRTAQGAQGSAGGPLQQTHCSEWMQRRAQEEGGAVRCGQDRGALQSLRLAHQGESICHQIALSSVLIEGRSYVS